MPFGKYHLLERISRLLSSADGGTVAMLQSYLYGRLDRQRQVIGFDGSQQAQRLGPLEHRHVIGRSRSRSGGTRSTTGTRSSRS